MGRDGERRRRHRRPASRGRGWRRCWQPQRGGAAGAGEAVPDAENGTHVRRCGWRWRCCWFRRGMGGERRHRGGWSSRGPLRHGHGGMVRVGGWGTVRVGDGRRGGRRGFGGHDGQVGVELGPPSPGTGGGVPNYLLHITITRILRSHTKFLLLVFVETRRDGPSQTGKPTLLFLDHPGCRRYKESSLSFFR